MGTNNQIGIWGFEGSGKKSTEKQAVTIVEAPKTAVKKSAPKAASVVKSSTPKVAKPVERRPRKAAAPPAVNAEIKKVAPIWGLETEGKSQTASAPPKAEKKPAPQLPVQINTADSFEQKLDLERLDLLKSLLKKASKKYKKAKKAIKKAKKDGKNLEKILVLRLKAKMAKKERNTVKEELTLLKLKKGI